jgi:transposase-like protein
MSQLAPAGTFCPYPECPDYGQIGKGNLIQYGKSRQGQQRFQCKSCQRTFNERKGTLFYNRKTAVKDILECLALLAEGSRISSISRVKGIKEDTILSFLREAAQFAEQIETILLNDYRIGPTQIDGLWTYVGRKGEKRGSRTGRSG